MAQIPVDTLYQVNVVVRDARAMALNYAELYGIERWQVRQYTPERLSAGYGYISATGTNAIESTTFQLIQPTQGESSYSEFLEQRGQGVHSLFLAQRQKQELDAALSALAQDEDIAVAYREHPDAAAEIVYLDTRDVLGGYYVQLAAPLRDEWQSATPVDEVWDFNPQVKRPYALDLVRQMAGINHFGVVVEDVEKAVERYAMLFGARRWRGYHWRTEPGSLEDSTNNGHQVEHAYRTARGNIARNPAGLGFGFELVQPLAGPLHFKDDFYDRVGPGIHHLSLTHQIKDVYEWVEFCKWIDGLAPTCMGGWIRDHSAQYIYKDTTPLLGYVIEMGVQSGTSHEPDLWYDFTERLAAQTGD